MEEEGIGRPIFALRGMFVVFCRRPVSGVHSGTGVRRLRKTGMCARLVQVLDDSMEVFSRGGGESEGPLES